ncbi:NUDIX domain-containing protein [Georgenia sp. H159]|uniref:NUDIX domain-containing protein n=1 Tax=Georgenia sp. H159 TaxID=3076115 RepID=UPI002D78716C|nr:NUDIX domain-containing protein [Georgenia sp. H159]
MVAQTFSPGRSYTEARVDALCAEGLYDSATVRWAPVGEGLLTGDHSGARYRRAAEPGDTAVHGDETPRMRVAAHAIVRDDGGCLLLIRPTYESGWLLPGGAVERDESPRGVRARELREELGRDLPVGPLLVLEWIGPRPDLTEGIMLVYDGRVVLAGTGLRLPPDELADSRWVAPADVTALTGAELGRRVAAALEAVRAGTVVELEDGARRA